MWTQRSWCQTRPGLLPSNVTVCHGTSSVAICIPQPSLCYYRISADFHFMGFTGSDCVPLEALALRLDQAEFERMSAKLAGLFKDLFWQKPFFIQERISSCHVNRQLILGIQLASPGQSLQFTAFSPGEFQKVWGRVLWRHQGCRPTVRHWQSWQVIIFKLNSLPRSPNAQRALWHSKILLYSMFFAFICFWHSDYIVYATV